MLATLGVTTLIVGSCMTIMAIGVMLGRKPVAKDCGLDPATGERVGYCACIAEGKEPCDEGKALMAAASNREAGERDGDEARVVPLRPK